MTKKYSIKQLVQILIAYAQVFRAPITVASLKRKINGNIDEALKDMTSTKEIFIAQDFCSFNKKIGVSKQIERREFAQEIIHNNRRTLNFIKNIPTIKLLAISGSVAAQNPIIDKEDKIDLDLFFIVSPNTLWFTYFFIKFYLFLSRIFKLEPHSNICPNYFLDERYLKEPIENFFIATEIEHLNVLKGKDYYKHFLYKNQWVLEYYPNLDKQIKQLKKHFRISTILSPFQYLLNQTIFTLFYLKNKNGIHNFTFKRNDKNLNNNASPFFLKTKNGGYQYFVRNKFAEICKTHLSDFDTEEVCQWMFPNITDETITMGNNKIEKEKLVRYNQSFKKYA